MGFILISCTDESSSLEPSGAETSTDIMPLEVGHERVYEYITYHNGEVIDLDYLSLYLYNTENHSEDILYLSTTSKNIYLSLLSEA